MPPRKSWSSILFALIVGLSVCADVAEAQFRQGGFGGSRRGGGFGGRPGGGGGSMLRRATDEALQNELKLTDEQKQKLAEIAEKSRENRGGFGEFGERFRNAQTDEEREALRAEMAKAQAEQQKKQEAEIQQVLQPEQFARLRQFTLQSQGATALVTDEVVATLKLTEEQKAKIQAVFAQQQEKQQAVMEDLRAGNIERDQIRDRFEALRQATQAEALAVLTATQQQEWQQVLGPPPASVEQPAPATTTATVQATPQPAPPAAVAQAPMQTGSTVVNSEGAAVVEPAVISFGERADETVKFGSSEAADPSARGEKTLSFNFRYAPWAEVLKLFADKAGLTLDLNQTPPGTFNYYDKKQYSPDEALNVLNGYLLQRGYLLVRRDEFLVCVSFDEPIPRNLIPIISVDELPLRGSNEYVSVVLKLDGLDAEQAAAQVQGLLGPQGKAVALAIANRISLTGTAGDLLRVHEVLKDVAVVEKADTVFKNFQLEHIAAADADRVIRDLFGLPARGAQNVSASSSGGSSNDRNNRSTSRFGGGFPGGFTRGGGDPRGGDPRAGRGGSPNPQTSTTAAANNSASSRVLLSIDERINTLLVKASPADMKIVEEAIQAIDVNGGSNRAIQRPEAPYLEVYQLTSADATEVTKTLDAIHPGVVVNEDGRARRVHIMATTSMHKEIATIIRQLDGQGGNAVVTVIPLGRMDSLTATATLQSLFVGERDNPPTIQPDPTGRGLLVRGTAEQITQIKSVLSQLDPTDGLENQGPRGPVRTVTLGGRDPQQFIEMLERLWNAKNSNPIRVVDPNQTGPVRDQRIPSRGVSVPPVEPGQNARQTDADRTRTERQNVPADLRAISASFRQLSESQTAADSNPPVDGTRALPVDEEQAEPAGDIHPFDLLDAEFNAILGTDSVDISDDGVSDEQPAPAPAAKPSRRPNATYENGAAKSPIIITPSGGSLVIASDDQEALDQLEDLIQSLATAVPPQTTWTVFYLSSADAAETANMLDRLFPSSSVSSPTSTSSSGFFGDVTGGISSMGRGLADLTGLSGLGTSPLTLRIIPETRSNALYVSGPADQIRQVEEVLKILDASELPTQLRDRIPRSIEVQHADVNDVAAIVRDVYKEEMEPPSRGNNDNRGGGNPFAMFAGGGSSRGGSRGGNAGGAAQDKIELTIGVDTRTNTLIVSASESIFRQIEDLVESLDQAALAANRTVRVVTLNNSNSSVVQQTLAALLPKVSVTTTTGSPTSSAANRSNTSNSNGSSRGSSGDDGGDQFRQMMRERMMQQFGGGGGAGGGPTSRFGSGGGPTSRFGGGGTRGFGGGGAPSSRFGSGGGGRTGGGRGR